ncbi:carbohydrate kinase family protein [Roseateles saccharophilus]|uniref:Pseudouridine kinase n=1 Tax=Roseateles saccharophilus TaxID=304 RepID=A0A4R3V1V7_ROSSA|nr:carbohydrate kinase family protein [Roseateles saccharophilus]MDG0831905.1 pseudouridine-5-phosphate glycosidase [Roseateles saccharophilus]TCU97431.1 pseudouridine kinase [Roseateles saccharophilus]
MNPSAAPIVCIGGLNIDRKLRLLAHALPASSNPCESHETPGGVVRNVAENLARLGLPVALIAVVGDDAGGRLLLEQAAQVGIDTRAVIRLRRHASDSYTAVLAPDGNLVLGLAAMPLVESLSPWALEASKALRAAAALVVADGNLPPDAWPLLLAEARAGGGRLVGVAVSEAKMERLPEQLAGLHLLILNVGELGTVAADRAAAFAALHARGVERVLVSEGARGLQLSEAGRPLRHWPAPEVDVVDVTGAGDALAAGICAALLRDGGDFATAARLGLDLAALTLQTEDSVHPELDPSFLKDR